MPIYQYSSLDLSGKKKKGEMEAFDVDDLSIILKRQNLLLVSAQIKENKKPNLFFQLSSRVSSTEVVVFIRQMSVMISASISVEDALKTIVTQNIGGALKKALIEIQESIYKGSLFSEALAQYPKIFPSYFRNMIYIGEVSGHLPDVLMKAANFYEKDRKVKRKAKSAMIYPAFLFVLN